MKKLRQVEAGVLLVLVRLTGFEPAWLLTKGS
jgi:hypothetical protein